MRIPSTFEITGPFDESAAPLGVVTMTWERTYVKHLPSGTIVHVDRFPEYRGEKGLSPAQSVVIYQPGIFGRYQNHAVALGCARRTARKIAQGLKFSVGRRWRSGISEFNKTGA